VGLPSSLQRSITFDRGTEFAAFNRLRETLEMTTYLCQSSAPWQKGSVENSNAGLEGSSRLKQTSHVSDRELQLLADQLNNIPRKCLGYRTPNDVLSEQVTLCR
jgi:IS30 family transposase